MIAYRMQVETIVQNAKTLETPRERRTTKKSLSAPWGNHDELFIEGFTRIPNKFFYAYANLRPPLTHGEVLFVLQLMTFKWEETPPYPSYPTLAKLMGVNEKTVQRYAQALCRKKYLYRVFQPHGTNRFDLTNLFGALANARSIAVGRRPNKKTELQ